MPKIVPIVEGDGEVTAVPALLRKLLAAVMRYDIQIAQPKNAHGRGNLTKEGGLEKFIKYACKEPDCGAIFVLLDAENECALDIAQDFSDRAMALGLPFPVVIVVANHMYEAWFLASIASIAGSLDLPEELPPIQDPEAIGNPKAWLNRQFPVGRAYKETQDQEAMTHLLNVDMATCSRSFRRLRHSIDQAIEAIDAKASTITPVFRDPSDD